MTQTTTTTAAPATLTIESEIDYVIGGLRDDCGVELVAANAGELLAGVEDSDLTAQYFRELARLFGKHARITGQVQVPAKWSDMSHYAKLKELARHSDNDVREKLLEVAEELRIESMADAEMEAYRVGNISRETLVGRFEELAGGDKGLLEWLRTHNRFGYAWHDDSAGTFA